MELFMEKEKFKINCRTIRYIPGWWCRGIELHLSETGSGSSRPLSTDPRDCSSATPAVLHQSCPCRCLRWMQVCCRGGRLWFPPEYAATWKDLNKFHANDPCDALMSRLLCLTWAMMYALNCCRVVTFHHKMVLLGKAKQHQLSKKMTKYDLNWACSFV